MGVIRWLDRIDPKKWDAASRLIADFPPSNEDEATKFLARFDKKIDNDLLAEFKERDAEDDPSFLLNEIFEKAVTVESWDFDKKFSHGLERILGLLPNGRIVVKRIVDFGGLDRSLPTACFCDSGLYGACSLDTMRECAEVLAPISDLARIHDLTRQRPKGFFAFLDRSQINAIKALRLLEDDYLRSGWQDLCTAVHTCVTNGEYLGLGMSG
jgi:hypothetical protein